MRHLGLIATLGKNRRLFSVRKYFSKIPNLPLHPFLLAAWFIIFEAAYNAEETASSVVGRPLILTLSILAIVFVVLLAIIKSSMKTGLVLSIFVLLFFGYGHVRTAISKIGGSINFIEPLSSNRYVFILLIVTAALLIYVVIRSKNNLTLTTKYLNLAALFLVAFNLYGLLSHNSGTVSSQKSGTSTALHANRGTPDIYYIVPDHYMNNAVMKPQINFDDKAFLKHLESKNFHVFDEAWSNYQFTTQSLSSTMNMRYLYPEAKNNLGKSNDIKPLQQLIRHNEVVKNLKSIGYKYVNVGSWWGVTSSSQEADKNYDNAISYTFLNRQSVPTEFEHLLLTNSVLSPFLKRGVEINGYSLLKQNAIIGNDSVASALYQLSAIKQAVHIPGPKYTFMHLLVPHPDYVWDKDCGYPIKYKPGTPKQAKYRNSVQCAGKMLRETVDYIIANSKTSPIIIIQADEGMYPFYGSKSDLEEKNNTNLIWWDMPDKDLQTKFSVLRAVRMPGVDLSNYDSADSSVNTFRILFNEYFGTNYKMLPAKSYVYKNEQNHYDFKEITDRLYTSQ